MLNVTGYNVNFDGASRTEGELNIANFFATYHAEDKSLNINIRSEDLSILKANVETLSNDFINFVQHILENKTFDENAE